LTRKLYRLTKKTRFANNPKTQCNAKKVFGKITEKGAAGPELLEATRRIGGCPTGEARISKGYKLPAKWVIHTVGPVWRGGHKDEDNLLASCYRNSFKEAEKHGIKTIAFPSISTGVYRFPLKRATEIALNETKKFLEETDAIESVVFVCFGTNVTKTYQKVFTQVF